MTESIKYKMEDIKFEELKFSTSRQKTGRRFLSVFYNKKPLEIYLPKLKIPFDSNVSKFGALEINLSLKDRPELEEKFKELDSQVEKFALENGWFENENYKYYPTLKTSENYPSNIRFKIAKKDGEITTRFFKDDKEEIYPNDYSDIVPFLKRDHQIISLVNLGGLWFSNINGVESYGLFWKVEQMMFFPQKQKGDLDNGYMFEDSSSDGSELDEYMFDE